MPPVMPFIHDVLWFAVLAGVILAAWKVAPRFAFRLPQGGLPMPFGKAGTDAPSAWFSTATARSSGNSAFDDWRNGELARIEAERTALEARLQAFEAFVDKLKQAKDRETFERFMAQFRSSPIVDVAPSEHQAA